MQMLTHRQTVAATLATVHASLRLEFVDRDSALFLMPASGGT